ncbi:MAG: apoptosis-inducing factor 2 [Actinomycetota bacterium]|jgi:hypothetical protein|nr:apoptosis-inducing factor 2 [Actinomycetota bacterium]
MSRTVVVIDSRDAFANVAGSLRAVTQPDWAGNMFFPFDTTLTRGAVIRDRVASVDTDGDTLASGRVPASQAGRAVPAARAKRGQAGARGVRLVITER